MSEQPDLLIITPSRGRPERLAGLAAAVRKTTAGRAVVHAPVDEDDPTLGRYMDLSRDGHFHLEVGQQDSLQALTNAVALERAGRYRYLASLGDDHLPITPGWDRLLIRHLEQLDGPGWAYGDDGYQGGRLPTFWLQHSALVGVLGWMMLPDCRHLYVDNAVLEVGRLAGRIVYVPRVRVEHQHPMAGKAAMDESYRRSNARDRAAADEAAYNRWRTDPGPGGLDACVAAVRSSTRTDPPATTFAGAPNVGPPAPAE